MGVGSYFVEGGKGLRLSKTTAHTNIRPGMAGLLNNKPAQRRGWQCWSIPTALILVTCVVSLLTLYQGERSQQPHPGHLHLHCTPG